MNYICTSSQPIILDTRQCTQFLRSANITSKPLLNSRDLSTAEALIVQGPHRTPNLIKLPFIHLQKSDYDGKGA